MSIYDDLWHSRVAPDMRTRLTMTQLLYLAPNDRYDRLMDDLNAMDVETLSDANDGSIRGLARLAHLDDLPLLARFAKQRLAE
jgi:digeranylgeranylglycerophospholipid reductase